MADGARPKKTRGGADRTGLLAAAAAEAARSLVSAAPRAVPDAAAPVPDARAALVIAATRLRDAEERHERVLARATARFAAERDALQVQLTELVQELGAVKHVVETVPALEEEIAGRDRRIAALEEALIEARAHAPGAEARPAGPASGTMAVAAQAAVQPARDVAPRGSVAAAARGGAA